MGADSERLNESRMDRNFRVSISPLSFCAMAGSVVRGGPGSRSREFLERLPDEAVERSDGVVFVLIEARLAIALEVFSRAYAVRERRLFLDKVATEPECWWRKWRSESAVGDSEVEECGWVVVGVRGLLFEPRGMVAKDCMESNKGAAGSGI